MSSYGWLCARTLALVVAMIVDLDQPRSGIIRVSQLPLVDVQRSFP